MKIRPWYRAWPETALFVFGIAWIPLLPRRAVLGLARGCGRLGYRWATKLREVGRANLDVAFGDSFSEEEKDRLLKDCFQNFALLVLDIIWFSLRTRSRLERYYHFDESAQVVFRDEPQLLLTAHLGNWENLGQAYAALGQPLMSVAAPLQNRSADKLFIKIRQKTGQIILPKEGAARKLLQGLRQRKKLAVLLDQNTKPREGGVFVDVLGLPAPVSTVPSALAVKTNAVVLTVTAIPDRKGIYTVTVHDQLQGDSALEDPVLDLTQRMTHSVDRVIRTHPAHWCWLYTRWRLIPEGYPNPERFPFYARPMEARDKERTPQNK